MKIKLNKTVGVFLGITLWVLGCIREDVMLPPVLEPMTSNTLVAGSIVTLNGNYLGRSALVLVNDTVVSVQGEPTMTQIQFIVPFVQRKTETLLYVTNKEGSSLSQSVTILPPLPLIKKIIPNRASIGRTIKLTGSYFDESSVVQFKSAGQSQWLDVKPTMLLDTLKVIVPVGLERDAADIRVKTQSGESSPTSFNILVAPKIVSLSHVKGGPGMIITLTGTDFEYVQHVLFGEISAEIISNSIDKLLVRVPDDAATDSLFVETEGGRDSYREKFTIVPKPEITALDKYAGRRGMELNITGVYFSDVSEVRFGNAPAEIKTQTATTIKTEIPSGAESGKIYITGPGGTFESKEDFLIEGAPLISDFEPKSGLPKSDILLTGLNLSNITKAYLGIYELDIVKVPDTDNQLKVTIRDGSVTGKISVTGPGGTFQTLNNFTVPGSPVVTTVSPLSGAPGTIVTITGENFPENPSVKFFDGVAATVSSATSTRIICQVPLLARKGEILVNSASSPNKFVVLLTPAISKIEPMQGAVGKDIVISGINLEGATVKFNTTIATTSYSEDKKTLTAKVPAGATTGKIHVTTEGGTDMSQENFTIISPPIINSFSPASGPAGTVVTINGINLQYNPVVQFFSQITASIKSVSPTQILVEVPDQASGNERISVRTDAVNNAVFSSTTFSVIGKPQIKSISPTAGTIEEIITINGLNFGNLVSVNFDGIPASEIISKSATQVVVQVPENVNATTDRTINLNLVTASDISGNISFKLLGTPTITKLSPDNNPTGWAFLITGTNLNNVRKLSLNDLEPNVGENGIEQKSFNYITTIVPKNITTTKDQTMKLKLHYTVDGEGFTPEDFKVLHAAPTGVFPPPNIILPPPLPSTYVQTDLSDYWMDKNYKYPSGDASMRCYQLRANFTGEPPFGVFCDVVRFVAVKNGDDWSKIDDPDGQYGSGSWNRGSVAISFYPHNWTGQVFDQAGNKIVFFDEDGRQLILVNDGSKTCSDLGTVTGPCDE